MKEVLTLKYTKAIIDVIELKAEDVVLTSGCPTDCPEDFAPPCRTEL